MNNQVGKILLPGDVVCKVTEDIVLGPGLFQELDSIIATKSGLLAHKPPNKYWIENKQKRYVPAQEDLVIGIILEKHGEGFKVDIGSAQSASLGWNGFELSSRKNRPNFLPGSIIYCRVSLASKDMSPEVACVTLGGKVGVFGPLKDGLLINCSLTYCRSLLSQSSPILQILGKTVPYEIAVGLNGRVWINSETYANTVLVSNAILKSEGLSQDEMVLLVNDMVNAAKRF